MQGIKGKLNKSARAAVFVAGALMAQGAAACAYEPLVGSVCYMVTSYCPQGFLPADGRTLSITQNQALFSLISFTYGGDGRTTFALPNLNGRSAIGVGTLTAAGSPATNFVLGKTYGAADTVTLNTTQVPLIPHIHQANSITSLKAESSAVSLPVTGSVTSLPFNAVASLPVVGRAVIATSATNMITRSPTVSNNVLLTSVGGPGAQIYGPAGTTNDVQIGPDNAVSGTASGPISGTATGGTISGSTAGPLSLPVTGAVTVTVAANTPVAASSSVLVRDPSLALTACIATTGIYPSRPD